MKQDKLLKKIQERERNLVILEDMSVINALLIMVLSLVFLIDIARYQWVLLIILVLGIVLNFTLAVCGYLRKKWIFGMITFWAAVGYLASLIYLVLF